MTTLESIGFTIAGGCTVTCLSLVLFGWAVQRQSPMIAPRATARPPAVIYNPTAAAAAAAAAKCNNNNNNSKSSSSGSSSSSSCCQDRGNPWLGWIPWTLSLTYDEMLKGVPGTGTRQGGLSGSMLQVNLDGIILLRFHALGLRVATVCMIFCLGVILPLNHTGPCWEHSPSTNPVPGCAVTNNTARLLTNYERTTLANIPTLIKTNALEWEEHNLHTRVKLYTIVFCFWILIAYTCYQLNREWIETLAIRRVYYLEHDVWGARKEELKQTLLYEEMAQQRLKRQKHFTFEEGPRKRINQKQISTATEDTRNFKNNNNNDDAQDDIHLKHRDPWIPHPEQRDTVPNVALYSILVGGLPSLPEQAVDSIDPEANIQFSKRESIDWQLSLTATFFDHCVPNQPGFSSSVAAVTICPSAKELAIAWRKWYAAASKLRRLRFVRDLIAERRHYEIEVYHHDDDSNNKDDYSVHEENFPRDSSNITVRGLPEHPSMDEEAPPPPVIPKPHPLTAATSSVVQFETPRGIYDDLTKNKDYYKTVLGIIDEKDDIYESLTFGPEQAAVYSREFAQAAAPCCPRGCFEHRLRRAGIDELMDIEEELAAEVHQANLDLKEARRMVTLIHPDYQTSNNIIADVESQVPGQVSSPSMVSGGSDGSRPNHRQSPSLEGMTMPSDLQLEAELYCKSESKSKTPGAVVQKRKMSTIGEFSCSKRLQMMEEEESHQDSEITSSHQLRDVRWQQVETLITENINSSRTSSNSRQRDVANGMWKWPSVGSLLRRTTKQVTKANEWAKTRSKEAVKGLARDSTYAVVTFTSRQAAVAARHCLSDGRGAERWMALDDLPIPPLADAAAWDLLACRNCCRPLALGVNERQKNFRNYFAIVLLGLIYFFYTIPLTAASRLVDPDQLNELFPEFAKWSRELGLEITNLVSGFVTALIWTAFFASCPVIFKAIANFGSKATSVASAEFMAFKYYWWFMVLTAFTGQLLANMALNGFNDGLAIGSEFRSVVRSVAVTVPSTVSVNWLNWIIFRMLATLPVSYLLQVNTFLFYAFGFKCCSRLVRGGGPGGPIPYRIFVDSGVVFMCALSLAPASPLVAPACFCYFVVCQPLLRRNLIFVYRPKFDGGGFRWPFVFDMTISAMVVGTVLLAGQMGLKEAVGPAIAAAIPIFPIFMFQRETKKRFLRAFNDAALLQTSLLDGWNNMGGSSVEKREEFRRFLVDAHKAAYVPVCLAATDTDDFLTAEPAVVVPLPSDADNEEESIWQEDESESHVSRNSPELSLPDRVLTRRQSQRGATLRRTIGVIPASRRRTFSRGSLSRGSVTPMDPYVSDDFSLLSPLERNSSGTNVPPVGHNRFSSSSIPVDHKKE